ncbi:hypothetical protein ACFSQT_01700 [Mesorhizobium calcicola]|uniref:Uncharacterized protein n=1 Tax=Mesorhizobium calcicola TaxID=1300310 RepID=A0ABW4W842_9HYPH
MRTPPKQPPLANERIYEAHSTSATPDLRRRQLLGEVRPRLAANLQRYLSFPSKPRPNGLPMFPRASWPVPLGKVAPAGRPGSMHRSTSRTRQKPLPNETPACHPHEY